MKAYSGRASCSSGTSRERSESGHGSLLEERQESAFPIKEVMGGIAKTGPYWATRSSIIVLRPGARRIARKRRQAIRAFKSVKSFSKRSSASAYPGRDFMTAGFSIKKDDGSGRSDLEHTGVQIQGHRHTATARL